MDVKLERTERREERKRSRDGESGVTEEKDAGCMGVAMLFLQRIYSLLHRIIPVKLPLTSPHYAND